MHDLLDVCAGSVSSSDLKRYAHEASAAFLNDGTPLDASITKIAKANRLNVEQTNRVVEMANNSTFKQIFDTAASKQIEFDLAEPSGVHRKIASVSPTYRSSSVNMTNFHIPGSEEIGDPIEALFGVPEKRKEASAEYSREHTVRIWRSLSEKLSEAKRDVGVAEDRLKMASVNFRNAFRSTVLEEDASVVDVYDAVRMTASNEGLFKQAMASVLTELTREGVVHEKVAGLERYENQHPNPDHPVIKSYSELQKSANALVAAHGIVKSLGQHEGQIKEAAFRMAGLK